MKMALFRYKCKFFLFSLISFLLLLLNFNLFFVFVNIVVVLDDSVVDNVVSDCVVIVVFEDNAVVVDDNIDIFYDIVVLIDVVLNDIIFVIKIALIMISINN